MKLLIIAGHGAGDSGAVGCGFEEADLTRTAASILEGKFKSYDVTVARYPATHDAYQDMRNGGGYAVSLLSYNLVIEVHFNSYNKSAYGTETLYRQQSCKALAEKVTSAIASIGFYNRGAKKRTDLGNMNYCYRNGIPYILIETCFIDNEDDMKRYQANLYSVWGKVAAAVCSYYGISKNASNGESAMENGWVKKGNDWYYYRHGEMLKNAWQKDSKGWCYLGSDGKMLKNAWAKDSVGWCYVGGDGHMLVNQWLEWRGDWYFLKKDGHMAENEWAQDSKGWCYLGSDGKMMKDTWLYWKSASYFLKKDGRMATGTLAINESFASDGKWTGGKQA